MVLPRLEVMSEPELRSFLPDAHGVVSLLSHTFPKDLLETLPNLRVIGNCAVGFNNIDVQAATSLGIMVTNTPDVLTETTADLAWTLILAVARRVVEGDRVVRAGGFTGWTPSFMLGLDVHGKLLGIVGMGRIGKAVARRAAGFNMDVIYHDPGVDESELALAAFESKKKIQAVSLEELLARADFVSLHCPLNSRTRHLIDERALHLMKRSAFLINTTRGPVVDEPALVRALLERRIAGAGMDVYENEPEVDPGLLGLDNVVLSPHLGSATHATRELMAEMTVKAVDDVMHRRMPRNTVNPEAFDHPRQKGA